ncbi:putative protein N(5)-glutamine methyltransferase [Ruania zhangjianzhongii]|uniref:putative protein N(5)-glutamine methyltransferase n=1 Tax=Ruania zhangjianzhongii TaxID=2603206 RepID=UPI0011CAAFB2|nr:putative protein N(5)-glutamine methyltransferase [Ruania zhangjianzhongii]
MRTAPPAELVARLRSAGCVFAEEEAALLVETAENEAQLAELSNRRTGGEPLEQVLGWVAFDGLRLRLRPGVFVPRQRTTFLVQTAAALAPRRGVVADVCCGVGAVAAALAARRPDLDLFATDLDPVAVAVARENLPDQVGTGCGDLLTAVPLSWRGQLGVVVANTPYVPSAEISGLPPEAREHEPLATLDGGADGLDLQRRLAQQAPGWLAPGGRVLTEIAAAQTDAAVTAFAAAGFDARVRISAEWGSGVLVAQLSE